jgi:hypothetical protein
MKEQVDNNIRGTLLQAQLEHNDSQSTYCLRISHNWKSHFSDDDTAKHLPGKKGKTDLIWKH